MHRLARFLDPRNTIEGKIVSVILSVVLVFSMVNLSAIVENASAAGSDGDALFTTELATDDKAKTQTEGGEPTQNQVITDEQTETNTPDSNQPDQKNNGVAALSLDDDQNSNESNNTQSAPQQQRAAATPTAQANSLNSLDKNKLTIGNIKLIDIDQVLNDKSITYTFNIKNNSKPVEILVEELAKQISDYNFQYAQYNGKNITKLQLGRSGWSNYTYTLKYDNGTNRWGNPVWEEVTDLDKLVFYYQIPVVPQGLTINPVQAVIEVNKTQRLIAAIAPSNTNKDNTITWESSDPSIATVNENGIVTGKKSGSVTITAKTGTNNDVTATAQVTVTNNVTITFDANGGSGSVPENIIANVDDYVNLPNKPENLTRENYKFIGWCTGTDASGVYDGENGTIQGKYPVYPEGSQIIMPENGCTLYAAWVQINGYADGTIVAAIIHAGSTIPAEPGCFNKTDTFDYTMVNGFNKVNVNVLDYFNPAVTVVGVDSVDKALTQKAKQELEEAVKKQSNLSYNPDTQYLAWHVIKDQQNDHKWHIDGTIQNKNTVKLEYDPNGATTGAIPGGVTAYKGNKVPVSDNVNGLARPGFNFIGWNTNADGSGTAYAVNSEITLNENVTLYAQWQAKNAVTIKYEATNGGAVSNGQDLLNPDTGTPQGSTPSAKPGYHFVNWTIKGTDTVITAGVDEETNQLVPTREEGAAWENITYVANFAPDTNTKYTVEYYLQNLNDNGYTKDETATVNATGTTDTEATAEEKSFDGFTINRAAEGTVATDTIKGDGSTVLKLYYDRNSYEVSYQYAEGTPTGASVLPEKQTVKFGAEVTVAPEATLAGYTFNGWAAPDEVTVNDGKFTMGSSNVVLTGSFTVRQDLIYTVNYLEYGTNNVLAPQAVVQNQTFDTTVDVNAIAIDGYALIGEQTQQVTISADEAQNVINFYYGVDNVSTDPANPGSSDGVPDMYQARVNFAAVNGSVNIPFTYVTLYDADGNYAVDGTGYLTANQIAAATAYAGYDQASLTWNVTPSTTTPITSEVTYTATFTATPVVPVVPTPTPVPAGPGAPAVAPGVPTPAAAAAAAPLAAPVATITDDATPLAAGETIDDEDTPLAAFDHVDCWVHWLILVGIILTAIYGAVVVRRRLAVVKDVDDLEDEVLDGAVAGATQSAPADNRQAI